MPVKKNNIILLVIFLHKEKKGYYIMNCKLYFYLKETASVISSDPPCKNGNSDLQGYPENLNVQGYPENLKTLI